MTEINSFNGFVELTSKLALETVEGGDDWWPTFKDPNTGETKILHHEPALADPDFARSWARTFGRPRFYLALLIQGRLNVEAYDNDILSHSVDVHVTN